MREWLRFDPKIEGDKYAPTASAIYENGVLRPTSLLFDLREGQRVQITIEMIEELTVDETAQRRTELLRRMRLGPLSAPD
jgi:predicted DNA-binding antitoxin AbrB/MazE fold protein